MGRHRKPALLRPERTLVAGLALMACALGILVAALQTAIGRNVAAWAVFFGCLLLVGLAVYCWVTSGLSTYLYSRPVDQGVDGGVVSRYDDSWHDHHSGEC